MSVRNGHRLCFCFIIISFTVTCFIVILWFIAFHKLIKWFCWNIMNSSPNFAYSLLINPVVTSNIWEVIIFSKHVLKSSKFRQRRKFNQMELMMNNKTNIITRLIIFRENNALPENKFQFVLIEQFKRMPRSSKDRESVK